MDGEKWEKYGGEYLFEDLGIWGFGDLPAGRQVCLFDDL